jgi:hypothetical protein
MAYQEYPWNGDGYLAGEVLRLRDTHNLSIAVETGTCLGVTCLWLSDHFGRVVSCELMDRFADLARQLLAGRALVTIEVGQSPETIKRHAYDDALYFLDAHGISGTGNEHCPLLEELEAIANAGVKPCIVIHDFLVPGTSFGFDSMPDGTPFHLELIQPYLDRIYGEGGWRHSYPTKVEGAMRGWVSVEPIEQPRPKLPTREPSKW